MGRWMVVVAMVAGCGRIAFDPAADAAFAADGADGTDGMDGAPAPGFDLTFPTCPVGGFEFVGTAICTPGALQLTGDTMNQVGAIWVPDAIAIGPTTSFEITITVEFDHDAGMGNTPGDGFAIVEQHDPRGLAAIGGTGGQLGYENIAPSSAVELDTYRGPDDASDNEIGIDADGETVTELAVTDAPFAMSGGAPFTVWVDYDGASDMIRVFAAQTAAKPAAPLVVHGDDLSRLGAAYFGVTASTAGSTEAHRILAWKLTVTP